MIFNLSFPCPSTGVSGLCASGAGSLLQSDASIDTPWFSLESTNRGGQDRDRGHGRGSVRSSGFYLKNLIRKQSCEIKTTKVT